ncbi:MAG TPA: hypothetical protein VMR23_14220 [Candidatus Limnocylindria bacterium]|nr:hypothetical protein [Candidatus Limnocylindria bacterium]
MTTRSGATVEISPAATLPDSSRIHQEGIIAGVIGAATVAVWFLVLDTLAGHPLSTPTLLGTALFHRGTAVAVPGVSLEMVLMFTWVHGLVFVALGGVASWLLALAERHPSFGFGVLMLFVIFQFGFMVTAMLFARPVLVALGWPAILGANLLAAAAMAAYFFRRHPSLEVRP